MVERIRAGFVGLGDMGGAIAQRIIDGGFPTTLWARRPESLVPYKDSEAGIAHSLMEMGEKCDFVGVCVFADKDVEEVVIGGGEGILYGMAPGGVIAIHSTVSLDCCARLEALAKSRSVGLLDAPVSGARRGAEAGTLCVMVGGERKAFEKALPVFKSYGATVDLAGPIGSGQCVKTLNNVLNFSNAALANTAFDIAGKMGLDVEVVTRLLLGASSHSPAMYSLVNVLKPDPGFAAHAITMIEKDTKLFQQICREKGIARTILDDLAEEDLRVVAALARQR